MELEINVRCKAFSSEGVRANWCMVDIGEHPHVRVWGAVAKHYTVMHVLSPASTRRIVRLARESAERRKSAWTANQYDRRSYPSET